MEKLWVTEKAPSSVLSMPDGDTEHADVIVAILLGRSMRLAAYSDLVLAVLPGVSTSACRRRSAAVEAHNRAHYTRACKDP